VPERTLVLSGERDGKRFFMTPCAVPGRGILDELFDSHDYWKGLSDSVLDPARVHLEQWGIQVTEDRDNFDYLYLRTDLAELGASSTTRRGTYERLHHLGQYEERPLTADIVANMDVLERWRKDKGFEGDFVGREEALELFPELVMMGACTTWRIPGVVPSREPREGMMFAVHS
jgi:hypothetical protein